MAMKQIALALILCITASSASFAQFALDVDKEEVRKKAGIRLLSDLPVGEKAVVRFPTYCADNGRLMMQASAELDDDAGVTYSINWIVKRVSEKSIVIEADTTARQRSRIKSDIMRRLWRVYNCRDPKKPEEEPPLVYEVLSIAGAKSTSEVFALPD
ncbi:hypothetical protein [Phyllobacterium sp. YR531]|uniref:hypothetical protein n=1 Tax=Phyllobacterium sp. YR531 TaxID=1144343 RepID=UPI00026F49D4|nr:hypothetical protein [Phyllobacterium sp. YR531]EJN02461.1 hypothetical protein PMI41_03213 [Phyllobacterium sp. YR531]